MDALDNLEEILKEGGTILYPTDTIWGIGCDATNEEACQKILKIKQRPEDKSFIVFIVKFLKVNIKINEIGSSKTIEISWCKSRSPA
jgi:L-threonylcarbamoyladenylate synthase